ncbi:MAG: DUF4268 domain-containing protein [Flavobacteriales bacterium]|jgi:hypothetical protein|nr:DUF4268 domain-containing protein [Flavobacteriales bacterium]
MYGKEEAIALRKLFWTSFGKYIGHNRTASGQKGKWLNYKTGVKDIYFRMDVDKRTAKVCIDIQQNDPGIRALFFEQFKEVKTVFEDITNTNEWIWLDNYTNSFNKDISRIYVEIDGVNLYNKETWNIIFPFLSKHLIALDEFWEEFKDLFKQLEK